MTTIAADYRIPLAELRAANPSSGSSPPPGTRLVIPTVAIPSAIAIRAAGERAAASRHRARRTRSAAARP